MLELENKTPWIERQISRYVSIVDCIDFAMQKLPDVSFDTNNCPVPI